MKSKVGNHLFIKELEQVAKVLEVTPSGEVKRVGVINPDGTPGVIDVLEKGYTLLTIFAAIWQLILKAVNVFKK